MNKTNFLILLAFVACGVLSVFVVTDYLVFNKLVGVDDANIFFVYADNLLTKGEIVWNSGSEKVEGFSSVLWLAICLFAQILSTNFEHILLFTNLLFVISINFALFQELSRGSLFENNKISFLLAYLILVFTSVPYIGWSVSSLMDTGLWSFAICYSILVLNRFVTNSSRKNLFAFSLSLVLLILTRSEGFLVSLILIFIILINKTGLKSVLVSTLVCICSFLSLTLARFLYFSYPFPNTYYAKVGSNLFYNLTEGWKYFLNWIDITGVSFFILLSIICCLFRFFLKKKQDITFAFNLSIFLVLYFCIYIYVGGDHFAYARHYQVVWPLCVFLLLSAIGSLSNYKYYVLLLVVLVHSFFVFNVNKQQEFYFKYEHILSEYGRHAGEYFNQLFGDEKPMIAAIAVGGIAYSYDGPVFDIMGLNDIEVAHYDRDRKGQKNHAAFNQDIFMKRLPEFLVHFGFTCRKGVDLKNDEYIDKILKNMLTKNLLFQEKYHSFWVGLPTLAGPNFGVCGYIRKDFSKDKGLFMN